jgi:hypothetical protein
VEYYATLKPPVVVGNGPYGMRMIYDVTGGEVTGPRLRGRVLPSGADWILVGTDGVGRLDVRATIETHDGANLYVSYTGILKMTDTVTAVAGGQRTEFGEPTSGTRASKRATRAMPGSTASSSWPGPNHPSASISGLRVR